MPPSITIGNLAMGLALHPNMQGFKAGDAAIAQTVAKIKAMATAAQAAKHDAQKLGEQMGLLERRSFGERWSSALTALNDKVHAFTGRIVKAGVAIGALGVGLAVHELKSAVFETAAFADGLDNVAQRTGVGREELQRLAYAAKLNDVEMEGLQQGLVKLAKGLGDVDKEGSPVAEGFRTLGISLNDPAVKSKNLSQILFLVANRFSAMEDGAEKAAAAQNIFSKSGAQMIPFLNLGVLGVKQLGDELDKMGGTIDDESVKRLAELNDQFDKTKRAVTALLQGAVVKLIPNLEKVTSSVQEWVAANRVLIQTRVEEFFRKAYEIATKLWHAIEFVAEHWKAFAAGFAAVTVINGLTGILQTVVSINSALGALNPAWASMGTQAALSSLKAAGAIGALISAALLLRYTLYNHDARDSVTGVKPENETASQAAQLRVARENAPDVDVIEIAPAIPGRAKETLVENRALPKPSGAQRWFRAATPKAREVRSAGIVDAYSAAAADFGGATTTVSAGQGVPVSVPGTFAGPAAGPTLTNNYAFTINAASANATEVARLVDDKIKEHDERTRRDTSADLGVRGAR